MGHPGRFELREGSFDSGAQKRRDSAQDDNRDFELRELVARAPRMKADEEPHSRKRKELCQDRSH